MNCNSLILNICLKPQAVCCSDEKHCCPHGFTCDTGSGKCDQSNGLSIEWLEKTESRSVSDTVQCPDGHSECPAGNTCCAVGGGRYGCCPKPNVRNNY